MSISHYSLAALGDVLWVILKWGVLYFVVVFLFDLMWNGAFMTFLQWGLEAGGGRFGLEQFLRVRVTVVALGVRVAGPLYDYNDKLGGMGQLWNLGTVLFFLAAWLMIVFAYASWRYTS